MGEIYPKINIIRCTVKIIKLKYYFAPVYGTQGSYSFSSFFTIKAKNINLLCVLFYFQVVIQRFQENLQEIINASDKSKKKKKLQQVPVTSDGEYQFIIHY